MGWGGSEPIPFVCIVLYGSLPPLSLLSSYKRQVKSGVIFAQHAISSFYGGVLPVASELPD